MTNKKPEQIGKHYFDSLKEVKEKPKIIKTDNETEHSVIGLLYVYFSDVINF